MLDVRLRVDARHQRRRHESQRPNGGESLYGHPFDIKTTYHSGIDVSLSPVARKNVQADNFGATTAAENFNTSAQRTRHVRHRERRRWRLHAQRVRRVLGRQQRIQAVYDDESGTAPPNPATIDLVPSTVDVYGVIKDVDGYEVGGVEVTALGQTVTTDDAGRYILHDLSVFAVSQGRDTGHRSQDRLRGCTGR